MSFINPKSILLSGFLSLTLLSSVSAQSPILKFKQLDKFHQPAAPNVEKADITVITCLDRQYYIYEYYRSSGANFRAIYPPNWGTKLGGGDHYSYEAAIAAACMSQ